MKIVCISDTHGKHNQIDLPEGDILIHAGDISNGGDSWQIENFLHWFSDQPHKHKVFIAGNHDFMAEKKPLLLQELIPHNIIYLNDEAIELQGIKLWGSPISPWFCGWAFNRHRGEEIDKHWKKIPSDTDLLITHGPVHGIRDLTIDGQAVGCEQLYKRIWKINPRLHVCGHVHAAYGVSQVSGITFVNASILNPEYHITNAPIVIDWDLLPIPQVDSQQ